MFFPELRVDMSFLLDQGAQGVGMGHLDCCELDTEVFLKILISRYILYWVLLKHRIISKC